MNLFWISLVVSMGVTIFAFIVADRAKESGLRAEAYQRAWQHNSDIIERLSEEVRRITIERRTMPLFVGELGLYDPPPTRSEKMIFDFEIDEAAKARLTADVDRLLRKISIRNQVRRQILAAHPWIKDPGYTFRPWPRGATPYDHLYEYQVIDPAKMISKDVAP